MSDYSVNTLAYYYKNAHKKRGEFSKYTIDTVGVIRNKKSGEALAYTLNGGYYIVSVYDDNEKRRSISVHRAVTSTFLGAPPSKVHTADHKESEQKTNNALTNLRWLDKSGQSKNRIMPTTFKTAFVIVKDDVGKTAKEWAELMNVTGRTISKYARENKNGFAYKEYPVLKDEEWKEIEGSKTKRGDYWKISNMKRVKYVTNYAENVLWDERLGLDKGYPTIVVNGKHWRCHILAFRAFYPELWKAKRPDEDVLHKDDDKEDFRPHMLRLGTASVNATDAHDNGKFDGKKTTRMKCASYIDGVLEKKHISQTEAAEYLKTKGCSEASVKNISGNISTALNDKYESKFAYGRTWVKL
jgi:hypothetical protein